MIPIFPDIKSLAENLIETANNTKAGRPGTTAPIEFARLLERLAEYSPHTDNIETGNPIGYDFLNLVNPARDFPTAAIRENGDGSISVKNPFGIVGNTANPAAANQSSSLCIALNFRLREVQDLLRRYDYRIEIALPAPRKDAEQDWYNSAATVDNRLPSVINFQAGSYGISEPVRIAQVSPTEISAGATEVPIQESARIQEIGRLSRPLVISMEPRDFIDLVSGRIDSAEITGFTEQGKKAITIGALRNLLDRYGADADLKLTVPVTADMREKIAQLNQPTFGGDHYPFDRPTTTNFLLLDPRKMLNCGPDDRITVILQSFPLGDGSYAEFVNSMQHYPRLSGAHGLSFGTPNFTRSSAVDFSPILPQVAVHDQQVQSATEKASLSELGDRLRPGRGKSVSPENSTPSAARSIQPDNAEFKPTGDDFDSKILFQETRHLGHTIDKSDSFMILPKEGTTYQDLPGQIKAAMQNYRPGTELSIKIEPQHLGKIKMKISYDNGRVEASLRVESNEIKNLLETDLKRLKEFLEIDHLKIDIDDPDRRNPAHDFARENQRRSAEYRNHIASSAPLETPAPITAASGAIGGAWKSRIDLLA